MNDSGTYKFELPSDQQSEKKQESKHTPGPWKVEVIDGWKGNTVYCRITSPNYEHPGGMAYTTIPFKGKTKKQQELAAVYSRQGEELCKANAELIARAPEMDKRIKELTEALEIAEKYVRVFVLRGEEPLVGENIDNHLKQIYAALTKSKSL
jgi:hypothetical protein